MLHRFQHDAKYTQVLQHLLSVHPSQAIQSARPFPGHQYDNSVSSWRDAAFLEAVSAPINETFLRLSTIEMPNLMEVAMAYRPGATIPQIYTKETCEDFHRLLCHLLRCYETSITTLSNFEVSSLTEDEANEFEIAVFSAATCGLTLSALAHSTFIDEHMCRILPADHRSWSLPTKERNPQEPEIEFQADTVSHLGRHAYTDWLRSVVEHYEAASKLVRMSSRIRRLEPSVEVVEIPQSGTSMRPWPQLVGKMVSSSNSMKSLRFTAQDAISAVENFVSASEHLSARLKGDLRLGVNFHGDIHSQACLASVIHHSKSDKSCVSAPYNRIFGSDPRDSTGRSPIPPSQCPNTVAKCVHT